MSVSPYRPGRQAGTLGRLADSSRHYQDGHSAGHTTASGAPAGHQSHAEPAPHDKHVGHGVQVLGVVAGDDPHPRLETHAPRHDRYAAPRWPGAQSIPRSSGPRYSWARRLALPARRSRLSGASSRLQEGSIMKSEERSMTARCDVLLCAAGRVEAAALPPGAAAANQTVAPPSSKAGGRSGR